MLNSNIISSFIFFVVAVGAWYMARPFAAMGGFFPRVIIVALGLFSLIQMAVSISQKKKEKEKEGIFSGIEFNRLLTMVLGIIGYILVMFYLGFVLSSILFLALFYWYLGRGKEKKVKLPMALLLAVIISLGFYGLFYYGFQVPLPTGILFGM